MVVPPIRQRDLEKQERVAQVAANLQNFNLQEKFDKLSRSFLEMQWSLDSCNSTHVVLYAFTHLRLFVSQHPEFSSQFHSLLSAEKTDRVVRVRRGSCHF